MCILRPISLTRRSIHRLSGRSVLFGLAFALLLAGPQAAISQMDSKGPQPECEADSQSSVGKDRQSENRGPEGQTSRCKGLLAPPPTGDRGLVEPAPPTEDMPVIRPDELPQQVPGTKQQ